VTGQSISVIEDVSDLDAAFVTAARVIARHGFTEPQVQMVPWLHQPDDTHTDPWRGYRVAVAGTVEPPVDRVPLVAPWPPPTGKAVGS